MILAVRKVDRRDAQRARRMSRVPGRKDLAAERSLIEALRDLEPKVVEAIERGALSMRNKVAMRELTAAIEAGDVTEALRLIEIDKLGDKILRGTSGGTSAVDRLMEAMAAGGESGLQQLPAREAGLVGALDLSNPEAVKYVRENVPRLIQEVDSDGREAIRSALQRGFDEGRPAPRIAREIRDSIGLLPKDEAAVANFRRQLETGVAGQMTAPWDRRLSATEAAQARRLYRDPAPKAEEVDRLAARYSERLLNRRAKTIARTEVHRAFSVGQTELWNQAEEEGYLQRDRTRRIWIVTPDERLRDSHAAIPGLNPDGVSLGEKFKTPWGEVTGPEDDDKNLIGCILPGVPVEGEFVAGLVATYTGDVVELGTESGARITLTVNHPVATTRGIRAAGSLAEGDCLIRDARKINFLPEAVDVENRPAFVEDVASALRVLGGSAPCAGRLDLHGDEKFVDGYVERVGAKWFLARHQNTPRRQFGGQFRFVAPAVGEALVASLGALGSLFRRMLASCGSLVGALTLLLSGLRRHLRPLQELGFRPAPAPNSRVDQKSPDYLPCDGQAEGQHLLRGSAHVGGNDGIWIGGDPLAPLPVQPIRIGHRSELDAALQKYSAHAVEVCPMLAAELLEAIPSLVVADKVVSIHRSRFSGHVYDLQSTLGNWILADGLLIRNCRCTTGLVFSDD